MDPPAVKNPNLDLAQAVFLLKSGPTELHAESKDRLLAGIKADNMAPYYEHVCKDFGWPTDAPLLGTLKAANVTALKALDAKIQDAKDNLGETDVADANVAKAEYLTRIGDKEGAVAAWKAASETPGPLGARIDMVLSMVRIGFFFFDKDLISKNLERAQALIDEGGDWDRRNRLRVYKGIHLISIRDFKGAITLVLDALATFTCTELMDYKDFVWYTVLTAMITLDRPEMKKKVLDAPEILEVIHDVPELDSFATSLYSCNYAQFYKSLAVIEQSLKLDRFVFPHYRYYVRELRIIGYTQLLESYSSLTLESMAHSFGVSEEFIDRDLSRYISSGRLNCVIDKVNGVVATNRPDSKNAQYQSCIHQGDGLLNSIQKLSRVINA